MSSSSSNTNDFISIPKGGGAIAGIGEKFSPDLQTGTGNFSFPISVPKGRNGLQPELIIQYSTGKGNGIAGLGWNLAIPGISRKTSKGIPQYEDCKDVFILSGMEDLVKVDSGGKYQPRTEGIFADIRFINGASHSYWTVKNKNGLISNYGTPNAKGNDIAVIYDPVNKLKEFSWNLTKTTDSFGNVIIYKYEQPKNDHSCRKNSEISLLHSIDYINYKENGAEKFLISIHLDYEDREDKFSSYKSGFEIQTAKRIKTISVYNNQLKQYIKRYNFNYEQSEHNCLSLLKKVETFGFDSSGNPVNELAPLDFSYSKFDPLNQNRLIALQGDIPLKSMKDQRYQLLDLNGNGLPDIVEMKGQIRVFENKGNGKFIDKGIMDYAPSIDFDSKEYQLIDANGDGRADILVNQNAAGLFSLEFDGRWDKTSFRSYTPFPTIDMDAADTRMFDITGDGLTDIIHADGLIKIFFNDADPAKAFQRSQLINRNDPRFPNIHFSDTRVKIADMNGDGMQDIVLFEKGNICYWPSKGYGSYGEVIEMKNSPELPDHFELNRVLLADINGDGLTDLALIENNQVRIYINQSGNSWSNEIVIGGTPEFTNPDDVRITDLLGTGVSGILWNNNKRLDHANNYHFLDLTGEQKPYLLNEVNNNTGAITRIEYGSSSNEYLDDLDKGIKWATNLPFPVLVVKKTETIDLISEGKLSCTYHYHHGHWDGEEREFRGFGMVEQCDSESFTDYHSMSLFDKEVKANAVNLLPVQSKYFSVPTITKTWFHVGPVRNNDGAWETIDYKNEFFSGDKRIVATNNIFPPLNTLVHERHRRDALRALRGTTLRTELYIVTNNELPVRPITVEEFNYDLRIVHQPVSAEESPVIFPFMLVKRSSVWEGGDDPVTQFTFSDSYNNFGQPCRTTAVAMPRRLAKRKITVGKNYNEDLNEQRILTTHSLTGYASPAANTVYIHDRVAELKLYERITANNFYQESDPNDIGTVLTDQYMLAKSLHDKFMADDYSQTDIVTHELYYYDGPAFNGSALGMIGSFGALVRKETLMVTDTILANAYSINNQLDRSPSYLGGNAPVINGTPQNFGNDTGYHLKSLAPYIKGYYADTTRNKYAFQQLNNSHNDGLLLATKDPRNNDTFISYDQFDLLPIKITNSLSFEIKAVWDYKFFSPSQVTDVNGNNSFTEFTDNGLVKSSFAQSADGLSGGTSLSPDKSYLYKLIYDPVNKQPIYVETKQRVEYTLSNQGDQVIASREYSDGFGRLLQKITQGDDVHFGNMSDDNGLPASPADTNHPALGTISQDTTIVSGWQVYNNKGMVVEKYEPSYATGYTFVDKTFFGKHSEFFYDALGRQVQITFPDGTKNKIVYGEVPDITKPDQHNPCSWEKVIYDANDLTPGKDQFTAATILNDSYGRIIAEIKRNSPVNKDEWFIGCTDYDIKGNPVTIWDSGNRNAFKYKYDNQSKVLSIQSVDGGTRTKVYDAPGNMIEYRDGKGSTILRTFDTLNRITSVYARDNAGYNTLRLIEKNIYDTDAGRQISNAIGKQTRQYDAAGLVLFDEYDFKGLLKQKTRKVLQHAKLGTDVDWNLLNDTDLGTTDYSTSYQHNALSQLKELIYPADVSNQRRIVQPFFNPSGNLRQLKMDNETFIEHIAYNAKEQRRLIAYGNKTMTRYTYDPKNFRLKRLRTESYQKGNSFLSNLRISLFGISAADEYNFYPAGGVLQDSCYEYDPAGNIISLTHLENNSGIINTIDGINKLQRLFTYDSLYQLTSATGRETQQPTGLSYFFGLPLSEDSSQAKSYTEKYSYDELGNLKELIHDHNGANSIRKFTYAGGNNRLTNVNYSGIDIRYICDSNGNLTDEGLTRKMEWNHSDRLKKFIVHDNNGNNSVEVDYTYDASATRVTKKVKKSNKEMLTIYIDGLFEHCIDMSNGEENNHLHIMDESNQIAIRRVGDRMADNKPPVQYHLTDHSGSSNICIGGGNASGRTRISKEEYAPYGETTLGSHQKKRYRYSGKERDEESGLYYYGARYYLPWIARWASCDPIGAEGGINLYQFVNGNPVMLVDVKGHQAKELAQTVMTAANDNKEIVRPMLALVPAAVPVAAEVIVGVAAIGATPIILTGLGAIVLIGIMAGPYGGDRTKYRYDTRTSDVREPEIKGNNVDPSSLPESLVWQYSRTASAKSEEKKLKIEGTINLDSSAVQSYATNPLAAAELEALSKINRFVITEAALDEALEGIEKAATGQETLLAASLLARAEIIPDDPHPNYDKLLTRVPKKNEPNFVGDAMDLIIFGTGVQHDIPTASSDIRIKNKLNSGGVTPLPKIIPLPKGQYTGYTKPVAP